MGEMKVEITETPKVEEPQKPVEVKKTEEPKYVRVEDLEKINQALNNTREYNNRKLSEINEKLERLIPKAPERKEDDLDKVVQENWQAGVEGVVERVLTKYNQKNQALSEEQQIAKILEESKTKVMSKHPELSDPESPKAKEFLRVLEENPDFRSNPRGPILAAYEMENRLKSHDTIESKDRTMPQEKEARAKGARVPAGTSPGVRRDYTLTRQDVDFCRLNNINPENYKKFKGMKEATV